jgi:hypothetical protein
LAAENLLASVKEEVSRWDEKEPEPAHQPSPDAVSEVPQNPRFLESAIERLRKIACFFARKMGFEQPVSQVLTAGCVVAAGAHPEPSPLPLELRASLNSALQLSFQVAASELTPGNFHLYKDRENKEPAGQVIGSIEDAKDDTFIKLDRKSRNDVQALFLEITPSCDFAQAKAKLPRFVLGFSFPPTLRDNYRDAQFTRLIDGPLFLTRDHGMNPSDVRFVALNAHYVFSISKKNAQNLKPAFRLRSPALTDIVAWVGAHAARPGYASVAP